MKKNRRWLLILAALIGFIAQANGLKATSLIFGKPSTTTTTTAASTLDETNEEGATVQPGDSGDDNEEEKNPLLTGIPQKDYVYDPNLPRELNGYNLSTYPFLDSVPSEEDIGFKCQDHHAGFYASIKYSCQLYHHCLGGIRYDFICPNFTAFDQKTFICHFASEIDCKNSQKYWFRNDALYVATTTTTTTTTTIAPPPTVPTQPARAQNRPGRPLRRPLRRRRPQVDYYYDDDEYEDDYYEERNRRKKQRPRNRRPQYDEDYEAEKEYEDDDDQRFRRPTSKDTRTRNRNRQNDNNRKANEDRRTSSDDRRSNSDDRRTNSDDRRANQDDRRTSQDDRRTNQDDRRSNQDDRRTNQDNRRTNQDDRRTNQDDRRTASDDRRKNDDRRSNYDSNTNNRDYDDDRRTPAVKERPFSNDRPLFNKRKNDERRAPEKQAVIENNPPPTSNADTFSEKGVLIPKPGGTIAVSSSIFTRPRAPPKISRPVPLNEKNKFAYSTEIIKTVPNANTDADAEYYDDEYEDDVVETNNKPQNNEAPSSPPARNSNQSNRESVDYPQKPIPKTEKISNFRDDYDDEIDTTPERNTESRPKENYFKPGLNFKPIINRQREKDLSPGDQKKFLLQQNPVQVPEPRRPFFESNNYPTAEAADPFPKLNEDNLSKANVRVVKRPFLPSRGGNPYLSRGLQPLGVKTGPTEAGSSNSAGSNNVQNSPPQNRDIYNTGPQTFKNPTTTKPQIEPPARVNLDDIYDNDYDVTLNDALNPTIKPITQRGAPFQYANNKYITSNARPNYSPIELSPSQSQYRRTAVRAPAPLPLYSRVPVAQTHYVDDYEY